MRDVDHPLVKHLAWAWPGAISSGERFANFARDLGHSLHTLDDEGLRLLRNFLVGTDPSGPRYQEAIVIVEIIDGFRTAKYHRG